MSPVNHGGLHQGAEGNYLTDDEFKHKYPDVKTNFLMYGGIIEAIRKYQQRVTIDLTTSVVGMKLSCGLIFKKVIKVHYH